MRRALASTLLGIIVLAAAVLAQNGNQVIPAGGSGASGIAGQTAYFSALNKISGGAVVLDMAGIAGGDLGAKMNNCATALGAGGGTCKGDNLPIAQTLSTAVTTAAPVVYTFCGQSVTQSANVALAYLNSAVAGCPGEATTFIKGANIDQFTLSAGSTAVVGLTLTGETGTYTGKGIVLTSGASNAQIVGNLISGEASNGISNSSSTALISSNTVKGTTSSAAILGDGTITGNQVTASAGDGIDANSNFVLVTNNTISVNVVSSTSGICAINAIADQIGDRISGNQIQISDTHSADANYGDCDTPTGTHNLNMLYEGDHVSGVLSGGATAFAFYMNNAADLNTNWGVTVRDIGCVHLTYCINRVDTQNNKTIYENIQIGDTTLDAGTGSTQDIWIMDSQNLSFSTLPTPAGDGSRIYCTDCNVAKVVSAGSAAGGEIFKESVPGGSAHWTSHQKPAYYSTTYSNATTTPSNIGGLAIPVAASTSYGIECSLFYQGSATTAGLDVTVTGPTSPTFVLSEYLEYSPSTVNISNANAFSTKMTGAATLGGTSYYVAKFSIGLANGSTAGTVQIQGSATGTGTVTVYQNSFCTVD